MRISSSECEAKFLMPVFEIISALSKMVREEKARSLTPSGVSAGFFIFEEVIMIYLWLQFIFCSSIIVFCGANLSRYGDILHEKKTFLRLGWDAMALIIAFIINIYLLYSLRGRG